MTMQLLNFLSASIVTWGLFAILFVSVDAQEAKRTSRKAALYFFRHSWWFVFVAWFRIAYETCFVALNRPINHFGPGLLIVGIALMLFWFYVSIKIKHSNLSW